MIPRLLNIEFKLSLIISLIISIIISTPFNLISQTVTVPPEVHLPILMKVLSYDRNPGKKDKEISIGILFQGKYRNSNSLKNEIMEIMNSSSIKTINDRKIKIEAFDISEIADLERKLKKDNIDYLYITPLRAISINKISEITKNLEITTISGVPEYIYNGISVGVDLKNSRPSIIINLKSALSEGADFNSQLLKIARIIE